MLVYPLNDNPDLLHTCYSKLSILAKGHAITHIVKPCGRKTLCGLHLSKENLKFPESDFEFDVWSRKEDFLGVNDIGCQRCKRSKLLVNTEGKG